MLIHYSKERQKEIEDKSFADAINSARSENFCGHCSKAFEADANCRCFRKECVVGLNEIQSRNIMNLSDECKISIIEKFMGKEHIQLTKISSRFRHGRTENEYEVVIRYGSALVGGKINSFGIWSLAQRMMKFPSEAVWDWPKRKITSFKVPENGKIRMDYIVHCLYDCDHYSY
jgi:hypothetical protein